MADYVYVLYLGGAPLIAKNNPKVAEEEELINLPLCAVTISMILKILWMKSYCKISTVN